VNELDEGKKKIKKNISGCLFITVLSCEQLPPSGHRLLLVIVCEIKQKQKDRSPKIKIETHTQNCGESEKEDLLGGRLGENKGNKGNKKFCWWD